VNMDPNFSDAVLLLAEIKIHMGDPTGALVLLQKLKISQPKLVQIYLDEADAQRELGNPSAALEIYYRVEKAFPTNSKIQLLKGSALLEQKDKSGARQAFNRVMELHPGAVDEYSFLALNELVNLDLGEGQFTNAENRVETQMAKKPDHAELHVMLANVFLKENNRPKAQASLQKTIELFPNYPGAYLLLAQSYYNAGQTDQALQMFEMVTQKDPKNVDAWYSIGEIENGQKNYEKAVPAYEKMVTIYPSLGQKNPETFTNYFNTLNNLAYIYLENLNQPDHAYELAKRAHNLMPGEPSAADTLGWVLIKRGDYQDALDLLQSAVAQMPDDPDVEFHFGLANYLLGNEDPARAAFQHALQISKDFSGRAEAQLCLAILAVNSAVVDDNTRALLEKRISEKTNDLVALNRLATIYQHDGKLDKAIAADEAILQADKNNVPVMINLVELYAANHDATKAYNLTQTAYQIAPNNPVVTHLLGQFDFQAGDYKMAMSLLSQTVRRQPDNAPAQFDFARAAYSLGKIPDTQTALQTALPNLTGASAAEATRMNDLINLTLNPSQIPTAATRVTDILKTEPNYVPALVVQEMIQEQNGDLAAAKTTGEKILETYPDFAPEQKQLARLYASDPGKQDRAYALAVKARANFPTDAALAKTYGIILFQQKNYSRALDPLLQSAAQTPNDGELFFYIGSAQFQLKRPEAKATLKQALTLKLTPEQMDATKKMLTQLK
jgi:tetratricopeptide (TPR) repeat protein